MKHGLVLLSDRDTDAPRLPAVATVSKYDPWPGADGGAFAIGAAAAKSGALWVDRPYFVGNPSVHWMASKVNRVGDAGGWCQVGNEQNLPMEGWVGGPAAWKEFELKVRSFTEWPNRVLGMPPSPGVAGWRDWVTPHVNHAIHAYGSDAQMREIVRWYLDNTTGDLFVTECNPGAGNTFALDDWAAREFVPFLSWCAAQPRVRMVAYFAWRWDQSPTLPNSVDGAGTGIERVLREFTPAAIKPPPNGQEPSMPPTNKPTLPDLCPWAEYTPLTRNFDREGTAPKIVVWHGTAGLGDPYNWWNRATAPDQAASADFWIRKDGTLRQYVKLTTQTSWSNGPLVKPDLSVPFLRWLVDYKKKNPGFTGNWWTVSVECEKDTQNADALTLAQIKTANRLVLWFRDEFGIPPDRHHHLGHNQFDSVSRARCPGPFPWNAVLHDAKKVGEQVTALRDRLWVMKDEAWNLGRQRLGDDLVEAVRRDKGEIA